ncbi:hypothetical protein [Lichenihabitans psoromatis]|uniref:hypothetical protein n=1 Tax=Lichenihabitans psoromatis TaxID=2528642 RepID=UPI001035A4AF|nr:hypothetical protein [Lichenihabitans psoromatis]
MDNSKRKIALIGVVAAALALPGLAHAQYASGRLVEPDGYIYNRQGQAFNPHEGLQPNGCVKLCEFDSNPCDPPSFKHADGRCLYNH